MTEDEEKQLRQELLMADLDLRRKQGFWETPRNLFILFGTIAAIVAALAGSVGYKIGSTPPQPNIIINMPPATTPTP